MKSKALELIYQDTKIHFLVSNDENVMINATDMAKAFNKKTYHFLENDNTKNFINACLKTRNSEYLKISNINDLIIKKQKSGTFFNKILALKFAAWLDPDFEIWIYKTIDQLLFNATKILSEKIINLQDKKTEIALLRHQIISSQNETAIQLLEKMDELKTIEYQKKKAFAEFASQLKIF